MQNKYVGWVPNISGEVTSSKHISDRLEEKSKPQYSEPLTSHKGSNYHYEYDGEKAIDVFAGDDFIAEIILLDDSGMC